MFRQHLRTWSGGERGAGVEWMAAFDDLKVLFELTNSVIM